MRLTHFPIPSPDELHRLDEDAPGTLLLRATLGVCGRHPEVREIDPALRTYEHHCGRHVSQRKALDVAVAIDAGEVPAFGRLITDRARDHVAEPARAFLDDRLAVRFRGDNDEVIAANVADEVAPALTRDGVCGISDRRPQSANDEIGSGEAERISERREVIQLELAYGKRFRLSDSARDLLLDRVPAG